MSSSRLRTQKQTTSRGGDFALCTMQAIELFQLPYSCCFCPTNRIGLSKNGIHPRRPSLTMMEVVLAFHHLFSQPLEPNYRLVYIMTRQIRLDKQNQNSSHIHGEKRFACSAFAERKNLVHHDDGRLFRLRHLLLKLIGRKYSLVYLTTLQTRLGRKKSKW